MTRIRIEGLLAAFPKLVGTGKQHTYVETENVRYVYQPLEQGTMFLLLVTNKQSNILEDLDILRLLSKVLPEYTQQQTDEEGISRHAFDLIFAFDEVISLGHKENVTMSQVKTFTEMESHEEKLHKMIIQSKINDTKDVMKRKAMEIDKVKVDRHGGGRGGGRQRQRKGEDVVHGLKVSLEDLYNGVTKKLSLAKNIICPKCDGKGSKSGASGHCGTCKGSGVRLVVRQIAPGMVQQMQTVCNECRGSGQTISEKDKCGQCHGQKVVQEKKVLEVHIEKGMVNNQKIVFQGEADEAPGTIPGDIVFVVQEKEHATFKRKGPDLFLEKDISLTEALCGFKTTVTHLDKRQLVIATNEGDVIKPNSFKAVFDEGMPTFQQPFNKGKLFVHFNVKFPQPGDLSDEDIAVLEKILPARPVVDIDPDLHEECSMHDVDMEAEMRRNKGAGRAAYDEDDDEDEMGGQRVQCAQQ